MAHSEARFRQSAKPPLFVDLDGTLVETDTLWESFFKLLRESPATALRLPLWLLQGRAALKRRLSEAVSLEAESLPYNQGLLQFLKEEAESGRKLALVTAADESIAQGVAEHLGIFSQVHASDGVRNLKGARKREFLSRRCREYAYAGDARADMAVWREAQEVIVVSNGSGIRRSAEKLGKPTRAFDTRRRPWLALPKAIRVHQWVKNLLLLVPVVMAHKIGDPAAVFSAVAAFFAFSLCASAAYLINDSVDLEADRRHRSKRHRPLASGSLPLSWVPFLAAGLLGGSGAIAWWLPREFGLLLAAYFLLTLAYSLRLKRIILLDILVLASLYTIRVMAGGASAEVPVSRWLLAFSMFIFLSLAAIKRFSELTATSAESALAGRGYLKTDQQFVGMLGIGSGFSAILVLALYASSEDVERLYGNPDFLWLLGPIFFYWIGRIWHLAFRGQVPDDPVIFAVKDPVSYIIAALCGVVLLLAL